MGILAQSVKQYLSAVGAAAIYVSVYDHSPKSVGVARDLDRTLDHLRRLFERPVTFGWIAWSQSYEALLAIVKTPDLMLHRRGDGVKIPKNVVEIVETIQERADSSDIVLTPHRKAVERAAELSVSVEQIFVELRTSGQLQAFNVAYKTYRAHAQARGEKVLPYWAAHEMLRRVTIKALATSPSRSVSQERLSELISQKFPWFSAGSVDSYRKRA